MLVKDDRPLKDEYARLAIRERTLRLKLEVGSVICLNCKRPKKEHCGHDDKCDNCITSLGFRCDETKQLLDTSRALELIEELQSL